MSVLEDGSLTPPVLLSDVTLRVKRGQFVRYGIAGVLSAAMDLGIFYLFAACVLPCLDTAMSDEVRAFRFMINKSAAFVLANGFSYWMNARWVFTPGRHSRIAEILLFFGVSTLSYLFGAQLSRWLISDFALATELAAVLCIGVATMTNFAMRKLLVFQN